MDDLVVDLAVDNNDDDEEEQDETNEREEEDKQEEEQEKEEEEDGSGSDEEEDESIESETSGPDEENIDMISKLYDNMKVTSNMVVHKKTTMTVGTRDIMVNVVDKMKDHFNENEPLPRLKFKVDKLGHLSYSEEYKDKNEEPSNKFTVNVIARYMELPNGPAEHQICAFDNVYLDLNAKFDKKKTPTKNYGSIWAMMYIPNETMRMFSGKFKADTGWAVSSRKMQKDEDQGLVGITVNFDDDIEGASPPHFFSVQCGRTADGERIVRIKDKGTIKGIYSVVNYRCIYRSTAFFTLSVNIPVAVGTTTPPETGSVPARINFTLNLVRLYSIANNVQSIRLGSKKVNAGLFA